MEEVLHHVVSVEDLGDLKKKVHITYDTIGVKEAVNQAVGIIGKKAQIKGFRKGHAPKQLIENYYPKEIDEQAKSILAQAGFMRACYEQKLSPLSEPILENSYIEIDGTFSCDIVVEVKPTINPTGYIGLKLTKPKFDREQMLNVGLEDIKKYNMIEVGFDEVKDNTTIVVDFDAFCDSKEVSSGKDQQFVVNKGNKPPFGENLFGMKIGETKLETFKMEDGQYANKDINVQITLKKVIEKIPPTNEELVEKLSLASYDELMGILNKNVNEEIAQKEQQAYEEMVVDKLIELHEFDVPSRWVEEEKKYFMKQMGIKEDAEDNIKEYVETMSKRNIKRSFILEAILNAEQQLQVSKEEFDKFMEEEAGRRNISKLTLAEDLKKRGILNEFMVAYRDKKIMNFLVSQAIIENEEVANIMNENV